MTTTAADVRARPIREVDFEPLPSSPGEHARSLVPLKTSGTTKPVFLIHGVHGQIFHFKRLVERVREDIVIYGLEARGLRDGSEPHSSVPEIARVYIAEIRTVQPHGPYLIAGFSFGVHIGWEMTRQLDAEGETVRFLAIDAGPPVDEVTRGRLTSARRIAVDHWQNWRGLEGRARRSYARTAFRGEVGRVLRFLGMNDESLIYRLQLAFKFGRRPERGQTRVQSVHTLAMDRWEFTPYSESFTLFRARTQGPNSAEHPTLGFTAELAPGGFDVRHVPGSHAFMFLEPHVNAFAVEFEAWVDRQLALERATDEIAPDSRRRQDAR